MKKLLSANYVFQSFVSFSTVVPAVVFVAISLIISVKVPPTIFANLIYVPGDFISIQGGIEAARDGDTILVADGVYSGEGNYNLDFYGKEIILKSENGPGSCFIDPQDLGKGFFLHSGETADAVIRGFTIQNARGGFHLESSFPMVEHCTVKNCEIDLMGAGMYCEDANPLIVDCGFEMNHSVNYGGGAFCIRSSPAFVNCKFRGNSARSGSAIYCQDGSSPIVFNCLFEENYAFWYGAGIYARSQSDIQVINSTFSGNFANYNGGSMFLYDSSPSIVNSILWGNIPEEIAQIGSFISLTYSDINNGVFGEGNISENPMFVACPFGGFYLSQVQAGELIESPCVDAGSDFASDIYYGLPGEVMRMSELTTRTDEEIDAGMVDMGFHYGIVLVPSPGVTSTPVYTPTLFPTILPVLSPTPSLTSAPGLTPTSTPSTSSSATKIPCEETGVTLEMPSYEFRAGDLCYLWVWICNQTGDIISGYPLFVFLDVFGYYWFAPSWVSYNQTEEIDFYDLSFPVGITRVEVVDEFLWPDRAGTLTGVIFWASFTNPQFLELFGSYNFWVFGWR